MRTKFLWMWWYVNWFTSPSSDWATLIDLHWTMFGNKKNCWTPEKEWIDKIFRNVQSVKKRNEISDNYWAAFYTAKIEVIETIET